MNPFRQSFLPSRSRGFTLMGVMAALAILAAFAIVSIQVAVMSLDVPARAADRENTLIHEAGTIERLREGVWSASKIEVAVDAQSVRLQPPSGAATTWIISKEGSLMSIDAVDPEDGPDAPTDRIGKHKKASMMTWKSFVLNDAGLALRGERTTGDMAEHETLLPAPLRAGRTGGQK